MVKIIETNLSMDGYDKICDSQSRVIEVESWDSYLDEIAGGECVARECIIGNMYGFTIPQSATIIENLSWNEQSMRCDVYNSHGVKTTKLAYLVREN